jgi:hypothetical protein
MVLSPYLFKSFQQIFREVTVNSRKLSMRVTLSSFFLLRSCGAWFKRRVPQLFKPHLSLCSDVKESLLNNS